MRVAGDIPSSHHCRDTSLASRLEFTLRVIAGGERNIIPGAAYPLGAPASVSTTVRLAYGASPNVPVKYDTSLPISVPYCCARSASPPRKYTEVVTPSLG